MGIFYFLFFFLTKQARHFFRRSVFGTICLRRSQSSEAAHTLHGNGGRGGAREAARASVAGAERFALLP